MSDIKILRAYARGRKLPTHKLIATINNEWLSYAYEIYNSTQQSSNYAKQQREADGIVGTEVSDYQDLIKFYNQYYPKQLILSKEYKILDDVHHCRFGELKLGHTIPFHIDEPFTLRSICIIKGEHRVDFENGKSVNMKPGQLYYINGCYKHSVINTGDIDRIALLSKFKLNTHNIGVLTYGIL